MKILGNLKTIFVLGKIFLVLLIIILFDRYQFTTIDEIKVYTYILYFVMVASFFGVSILIKYRLDKKKEKHISKLDNIINISYTSILFIGFLVISFGILLSSAHVALPADNTIEEVNRFLEQYKIITMGRNMYINALIAQLLATLVIGFYYLFKDTLKEKE